MRPLAGLRADFVIKRANRPTAHDRERPSRKSNSRVSGFRKLEVVPIETYSSTFEPAVVFEITD